MNRTKRLSILFLNSIAPAKYGGGEKWMIDASSGLVRRGHRVWLVGRPGSRFLAMASARGLDTEPLRFRGDFGPIAIVRLARLIRRRRVDLVCANYHKELRLCGFSSILAGRRPVFVARKGLPLIVDKLSHRLTYRFWVDAVITPSQAIKRRVSEISWLDPAIVHVIPNGVDPSRYDGSKGGTLRGEFGLGLDVPLIGFVGRLETQKRPDDLIRATSQLAGRFPLARVIFVGDGPLREELAALAREMGLADRVLFAGFREAVHEILPDLDVLVLPSQFEGQPNIVLEAMAAGVPVVASDVEGIDEIIVSEEMGVIVPVGNIDGLAEGIAGLLASRERRAKIAEAARAFVRERFSRDRMVESIESLFLDLTTWQR